MTDRLNLKTGLSATALKMIAVICMIMDHCAYYFLNQSSIAAIVLHTFGRICAPVIFYLIAEGFSYSRDLKKYALRLFIFALISHVPFSMFQNNGGISIFPTSIIFTLLCGLLALWVWSDIDSALVRIITVTCLVAVTIISDWQVFGVLFILLFGIFDGNKKSQMISFAVIAGFKIIVNTNWNDIVFHQFIPLFGMFLAIPLLLLYNGERGGNGSFISKWFFYIFYPLQFLIIVGIKMLTI